MLCCPLCVMFKRKARFKGDWGRVATTAICVTERFSVCSAVSI